ncbi:MAG: DapH/DapD/GlmU-related protein [Myxococcota bacterium]
MTSIVDNAFHGLYQRYVRPEPKPVRLGNDVWLGRGVSILPGVTIGDGAVVGSGSVVTHDVAAYSVVAGVPAHKIKDLDPQDFVVQALEYANRAKRAP